MHLSRISTICLDVPAISREASEQFWTGALGVTAKRGTQYPEYSSWGELHGQRWLLQTLGQGEARIHLDIHTDNGDAEVARLVALGAEVVTPGTDWSVLRDPGGLIFCVVPVEADDPSLLSATQWP